MISLDERGATFPTTLLLTLLTLMIVSQSVIVYISQYSFVNEMREYYKTEASKLLQMSQLNEDEYTQHLLYNKGEHQLQIIE